MIITMRIERPNGCVSAQVYFVRVQYTSPWYRQQVKKMFFHKMWKMIELRNNASLLCRQSFVQEKKIRRPASLWSAMQGGPVASLYSYLSLKKSIQEIVSWFEEISNHSSYDRDNASDAVDFQIYFESDMNHEKRKQKYNILTVIKISLLYQISTQMITPAWI